MGAPHRRVGVTLRHIGGNAPPFITPWKWDTSRRVHPECDDVEVTIDPQLKVRLKAWTWHDIWRWPRIDSSPLVEVAKCGEEGSELLVEEFRLRADLRERGSIAGALGITTGSAGIEELRQAAKTTGPGTSELRAKWTSGVGEANPRRCDE